MVVTVVVLFSFAFCEGLGMSDLEEGNRRGSFGDIRIRINMTLLNYSEIYSNPPVFQQWK